MASKLETKTEGGRQARRERDARVNTQGAGRMARAREKADVAAAWVRTALYVAGAAIIAVAAFFGGVFPFLFGGILHGLSEILGALSVGVAALGAWMRRNSDEPREKAVWLLVVVFAIGGLFFFVVGV